MRERKEADVQLRLLFLDERRVKSELVCGKDGAP